MVPMKAYLLLHLKKNKILKRGHKPYMENGERLHFMKIWIDAVQLG